MANIIRLQKRKQRARVAAGLPADLADHSMDAKYQDNAEMDVHGEGGLADATDQENLYFVYLRELDKSSKPCASLLTMSVCSINTRVTFRVLSNKGNCALRQCILS